MSKATPRETATQGREGKSYGYQKPQESIADVSVVDEQKRKVVAAFDDFMTALAGRTVPPPVAGGGTSDPAAGGTGTTGGAGTTGGTGTTGGSGTPGAPVTGGAPSSGGSSSGPQSPNGAPGGEKASEAAAQEAYEMSIFSQREAYRLDRVRESNRKARSQESSSGPAILSGGTGLTIIASSAGKHTSDSNRSPLTEAAEFGPAFGSTGKSLAPTIEKMSIPPSQRPETVPAPGTVSLAKPIDAYFGSFGTAIERAVARAKVQYQTLEVIIGNDDRVRVTNNELYPWRCICSLLITANTGATYIGTGWLVAPRLVLTAGHCVFMADEGGWVTQIEVIPGRNATARPFGSAIARDFRSVSGWTRDNDSDFDYGAILLPADKRYGEQLGWFGYANRPDDYLRSVTLNLAGYPGDGGKAPNQVDGSQWFHSRTVKDVLARQLTYEIDTYGGQSGAPVWEMTSNGNRYGVAIHTYGTSVNNGGTRITGDVFNNIVAWAGLVP